MTFEMSKNVKDKIKLSTKNDAAEHSEDSTLYRPNYTLKT